MNKGPWASVHQNNTRVCENTLSAPIPCWFCVSKAQRRPAICTQAWVDAALACQIPCLPGNIIQSERHPPATPKREVTGFFLVRRCVVSASPRFVGVHPGGFPALPVHVPSVDEIIRGWAHRGYPVQRVGAELAVTYEMLRDNLCP